MTLDAEISLVILAAVGFLLGMVLASAVFNQINTAIQNPNVKFNNTSSVFSNVKVPLELGGLGYVLAVTFIPLGLLYVASRREGKTQSFAGLEDVAADVVFLLVLIFIAVIMFVITLQPAATAYTAATSYGWANAVSLGTLIQLGPLIFSLGIGVMALMKGVEILRD